MENTRKNRKLLRFFFSIVVAVSFFFSTVPHARAAVPFIPVGGKIWMVLYCTNGVLTLIGPPRPGLFMYIPFVSQLFAFYQIYRPGPCVLGKAVPPGVCNWGFINIPALGTYALVGTSLIGPPPPFCPGPPSI